MSQSVTKNVQNPGKCRKLSGKSTLFSILRHFRKREKPETLENQPLAFWPAFCLFLGGMDGAKLRETRLKEELYENFGATTKGHCRLAGGISPACQSEPGRHPWSDRHAGPASGNYPVDGC